MGHDVVNTNINKKAPHFCEAFLAPLIDRKYNHLPMVEYVMLYKLNRYLRIVDIWESGHP
jgi:hypothetical protein